MKECRIIIMGFGSVGQGIAQAIALKKAMIKNKYGVELKVVAAADSSTSAINQDGLDEMLLIHSKNSGGDLSNYPNDGTEISGLDVLDAVEYDLLMEATPTNISTAEPALSLTYKAFDQGKDVVTSNKGHLALKFKQVVGAAEDKGVEFRYEASVGGAMPIINFTRETLSSCGIESITGILNGTTNYILSRMSSEGSPYDITLKESQELGIAETDPTQDVEGIDAACKTVILANSLLGVDATYDDVEVEGISNITSEAIELAGKDGYLIKLIAEVSKDTLKVSPRLVKKGSAYDLSGTLNMANIKTDLAGDVTVMGLGAGSLETASAMLTDVISILKLKY
ncbi:MAG: homoserine dehydrogenase [Methanobrevibacter sp.]|uniref:Homoserine dehydrogenase n=1 Tax=Methanobrevibacter millerae TaxID=230361 RepID=A0A8T3VPF0_9EURY|nr:homoserine dehydrogenase [Methanobrevibacter sp.]MBE6509936.1 homoserine dehydrogenase [Methanobrevibacter millerae]MBO5151984.1 homoserine dehydrogenase [Methanobrevibacter sp.]MBO6109974.1 homoserine dehydrogenase [Methanobrevibacter sp.]